MIYGQPTTTVHKLSNQATFLEKLFTDVTKIKPPDINSEEVRNNLHQVKELHDAFSNQELLQNRYQLFDQSLYKYIYNVNFENDEPTAVYYRSIIKSLFNDVVPLIYKMKLHFQFPRPFQLAALHKISIYPEQSLSAQCPSFPSMHACMGHLLVDVCSNNFPPAIPIFQGLDEDLSKSRLAMGVCIESDTKAGSRVADMILADKEFKIKYKL